jgi:hypothetical protein
VTRFISVGSEGAGAGKEIPFGDDDLSYIELNVMASLNFMTYNIPEWAPSRSWDAMVLSLTCVRRDEI